MPEDLKTQRMLRCLLSCRGGAYRNRPGATPPRPRTRRLQITYEDTTLTVYVGIHLPSEHIAAAAAVHFGIPPQWVVPSVA